MGNVRPGTRSKWAPRALGLGFHHKPAPSLAAAQRQLVNRGLARRLYRIHRLSHQGSPRILKWVAYPFSRGTFWPRNQSGVSCIAGGLFAGLATRKPSAILSLICVDFRLVLMLRLKPVTGNLHLRKATLLVLSPGVKSP